MNNENTKETEVNKNVYSSIKKFLYQNFGKEIREEVELDKKYGLTHTEEELQLRNRLQEENRQFSFGLNRRSFDAIRSTWSWLRKYYFNLSIKDSMENYEYSKTMRDLFFKSICASMVYSIGYTLAFYFLWMRLIKQKGSQDWKYLLLVNGVLSVNIMNYHMYFYLLRAPLPLSHLDLQRRRELLVKFVYDSNLSFVVTEEIKKISKKYCQEEIIFPYTTRLGQHIKFIVKDGRLYVMCDNYDEVFGYSSVNKSLRIQRLSMTKMKEREIIFGLFKLYDALVQKYMQKYNIINNSKNIYTKIFEQTAKLKNLNKSDLDLLKKTKVLKDVNFSQLEMGTPRPNLEEKKEVIKEKPKFYF